MTDAIQPAPRPWYRLHLSTWLLLLPAVVVLLLLNVPGDESVGVMGDGQEMLHGFPVSYLRREMHGWAGTTPFLPLNPWRLNDRVTRFWPLALAIDAGVAVGVLAIYCAVVESRRRRQPLYQFTIRELLLLTTLSAAGLGWWTIQRDKENRFLTTVESLQQSPRNPIITGPVELIPAFPNWIRDAVGDERIDKV